jgi:hypothetical protein
MNEVMTTKEILDWCDRARRRFYLRPGYIAHKGLQLLTEPQEAGKTIKSFFTFSKHLLRNVSDRDSALTERNQEGFKDNSERHSVAADRIG